MSTNWWKLVVSWINHKTPSILLIQRTSKMSMILYLKLKTHQATKHMQIPETAMDKRNQRRKSSKSSTFSSSRCFQTVWSKLKAKVVATGISLSSSSRYIKPLRSHCLSRSIPTYLAIQLLKRWIPWSISFSPWTSSLDLERPTSIQFLEKKYWITTWSVSITWHPPASTLTSFQQYLSTTSYQTMAFFHFWVCSSLSESGELETSSQI